MDINGGDKNRVFLHDLIKITEGTVSEGTIFMHIPKTNVDALRSTLLQALVKYKFVNFFLSMLKKKILQIITVIPLYNLLR